VVLLIAPEEKKADPVKKALKAEKIQYRFLTLTSFFESKGHDKADAYIIFGSYSEEKGIKELIRKINCNSLIILAGPEKEEDALTKGDFIFLPEKTAPFLFTGIVKWYLKSRNQNICKELLKSFFKGSKIQIFFINGKGSIISGIPLDEPFLGHTIKHSKNKNFEDIFGVRLEDIPETESDEHHIRYLLNEDNKEVSCNISKLPYSSIEIPGIPQKTEWVIFATEISEIKTLKDRSDRMSLIQESMMKERTVELESANEMLQKQALELKHTLEELEKKNRQIVEELSLAAELQASLLPKEFPSDLPLNFAHKYIPYAYIGGDFFDIVRLNENKIGIIIADVSGHGVSSAFITTMFKSQFDIYGPKSEFPAETLSILNKEFTNMIHTEHYITAFYAVIDTDKMICTYCNAGHPNQLLFKANGEVIEMSSMGFFLGMFEGTEYEDKEVGLETGDRILFNTDGIIETTNAAGEQFGKENIIRVIKDNRDNDLETLSNKLLSEIMMYMADPTFQDDITILLTEVIESL